MLYHPHEEQTVGGHPANLNLKGLVQISVGNYVYTNKGHVERGRKKKKECGGRLLMLRVCSLLTADALADRT